MAESKEETNEEFFSAADAFIKVANDLTEDFEPQRVSAVMLFAATRYNAFTFYSTDGKPENRARAVEYMCEQYRKMLNDNLDELEAVYAKPETTH